MGTSTRTLTAADDGTTITAAVGEAIRISLEENPSTGYAWAPSTPPAGLELTSELVEPAQPPGRVILGAPGTRTFTLTPTGAGRVELVLTYHRGWMPPQADDRTFRITLDVGEAEAADADADAEPADEGC